MDHGRPPWRGTRVALLAEGVDRNIPEHKVYECDYVALLAEGVDRNGYSEAYDWLFVGSPSSRRAWIEIEN